MWGDGRYFKWKTLWPTELCPLWCCWLRLWLVVCVAAVTVVADAVTVEDVTVAVVTVAVLLVTVGVVRVAE